MLVREAAIRIKAKYKNMEIIEALPGHDKFIFCLKPKGYNGLVMDSYYYVDKNGKIGEYAYGNHMDEWRYGMKHQFSKKDYS